MKKWTPFLLAVGLVTVVAWAQSRVTADQGRPGKEGSWPVTGTLTVVMFDDGGSTRVSQGPSRDGGTDWPVEAKQSGPWGVGIAGQVTVDGGYLSVDQRSTSNPWIVSGTTTTNQGNSRDGGTNWPVETTPHPCDNASPNKVTSVVAVSTTTPATAQAGRIWTSVCNSPQNVASRVVKCRADGTAPVFAAGNAGDVLQVGDCVTYTVNSARNILCIANTGAGTDVQTYECI